jgi:GTP cyclohydrolase I
MNNQIILSATTDKRFDNLVTIKDIYIIKLQKCKHFLINIGQIVIGEMLQIKSAINALTLAKIHMPCINDCLCR